MCTKTARQTLSAFEYLTGMAIVAAVAVVPLPLIVEGTLGTTDASGWIIIVYLAVVNGLLGHFLMAYAHGHVKLLTISLLTLAIPVSLGGGRGGVASTSRSRPCRWRHGDRARRARRGVAASTARRAPDLVDADLDAMGSLPHP